MERHQRDLRIRRLTVACIYILIIISLMAVYLITRKHEQRAAPVKAVSSIASVVRIEGATSDAITHNLSKQTT